MWSVKKQMSLEVKKLQWFIFFVVPGVLFAIQYLFTCAQVILRCIKAA